MTQKTGFAHTGSRQKPEALEKMLLAAFQKTLKRKDVSVSVALLSDEKVTCPVESEPHFHFTYLIEWDETKTPEPLDK